MIGLFSFLKFSIFGNADNQSWVLIDARYTVPVAGESPLWGLFPIPFEVSPAAQFIQSLIPGVGALVPLKIGDENDALHQDWAVSIWIKPETCRSSPCMPVLLLSNSYDKRGGQGQSWVTLELQSIFQDSRVAAFSFTLCLRVNSLVSMCSKSAAQIYPSAFSQFVVTYSELDGNFLVRMYVNRAEVLSYRGS